MFKKIAIFCFGRINFLMMNNLSPKISRNIGISGMAGADRYHLDAEVWLKTLKCPMTILSADKMCRKEICDVVNNFLLMFPLMRNKFRYFLTTSATLF